MCKRVNNSRVVAVDTNKSKEKVEILCYCWSDLESEYVVKFCVYVGMIWSPNKSNVNTSQNQIFLPYHDAIEGMHGIRP